MLRNATWNNVGTDISRARNINEALNISGLNFEVEKQKIYLPDGKLIPNKVATVDTKSGKIFGVVGDDYSIIQNQEAFQFIDYVAEEGAEFVKAGTAAHDNLIYVICKMPEENILRDTIAPYIIFQNSFSGYSTLKAAVTDLRVVCQNQFNFAFKNADNVINIRHTASAMGRLQEAANVVDLAKAHITKNREEAEALATIKLSDRQADEIVNNIFKYNPEDVTERTKRSMDDKRIQLLSAYRYTEDLKDYYGTGYGLAQAYSDMITHQQTKKSDENKFLAVSLDPRFMMNIVSMIKEAV